MLDGAPFLVQPHANRHGLGDPLCPTVSNRLRECEAHKELKDLRAGIPPSASARRSMSRASDIFILGFTIQDQEEEFDPCWG